MWWGATVTDDAAARSYHQDREARRRAEREAFRADVLARAHEAIQRLVPGHPQVRQVYLFGSIVQVGRYRPTSDIDVAVVCDTPEAESAFWRALEHALRRDVDVRPLTGAVAEAVQRTGVCVYAGKGPPPGELDPS